MLINTILTSSRAFIFALLSILFMSFGGSQKIKWNINEQSDLLVQGYRFRLNMMGDMINDEVSLFRLFPLIQIVQGNWQIYYRRKVDEEGESDKHFESFSENSFTRKLLHRFLVEGGTIWRWGDKKCWIVMWWMLWWLWGFLSCFRSKPARWTGRNFCS